MRVWHLEYSIPIKIVILNTIREFEEVKQHC